jgi:ADP-heptose:LPS heptosyltransferase
LKTILYQFDYWIKNTLLKLVQRLLYPFPKKHHSIARILVFRTGSLGDSICSLPALDALRHHYPDARIEVLTETGGTNLIGIDKLAAPSLVDAFIFYKNYSLSHLIGMLRQNQYDLFVLLPQAHAPFRSTMRNLLFARWINAKKAIGFKMGVTRVFARQQAKGNHIPNVREFFMSILSELNIQPQQPYRYPFNIQDEDIRFTDHLLAGHQIRPEKTLAIVAGAKRDQNRWPLSYFDKTISYFVSRGYQCILIGGAEDQALVKKLNSYPVIHDFTGQLTPIQSGLIMGKCRLTLSNDTGPLHLAYAFGARVVALFSSRDYPDLWFPPKEQAFTFRNQEIHCSECFTETCGNNLCMQGILPESVIAKMEEMLR